MSRRREGPGRRAAGAPIRLLQGLSVIGSGVLAVTTSLGLGYRLARRPLPWTSAQVDRVLKPAAAATVLAGLLLIRWYPAADAPARRTTWLGLGGTLAIVGLSAGVLVPLEQRAARAAEPWAPNATARSAGARRHQRTWDRWHLLRTVCAVGSWGAYGWAAARAAGGQRAAC